LAFGRVELDYCSFPRFWCEYACL